MDRKTSKTIWLKNNGAPKKGEKNYGTYRTLRSLETRRNGDTESFTEWKWQHEHQHRLVIALENIAATLTKLEEGDTMTNNTSINNDALNEDALNENETRTKMIISLEEFGEGGIEQYSNGELFAYIIPDPIDFNTPAKLKEYAEKLRTEIADKLDAAAEEWEEIEREGTEK